MSACTGWRALAATVVPAFCLALTLACSSGSVCGPGNCTGCCDSKDQCQSGFTDIACGSQGASCQTCAQGTSCGFGGCGFGGGGGGGSIDGGNDAGTDGGTDAGTDGGTDRAAEVCARWLSDRADLNEGTWTGDLDTCTAGDNVVGRANALRNVNLYRFLAGLPAVTTDPTRDAAAQECALMMKANIFLTHNPPETWTCYTPVGGDAASRSNLAPTPGVSAVGVYMIDNGADTLGHRRYILAPKLGPIGLGTTDTHSCMWVTGGTSTETRPFVAFPSPGPFPLQAFDAPLAGASLSVIGWSVQSDSIDLTSAVVTVTRGAEVLPVAVEVLDGYIGSVYALRITPDGWTHEAGESYAVSVSEVTEPFSYSVDVIDCE